MPRESDNECLVAMPPTVIDPWAAARLPECRAVRLRVRFEAFGASCACERHGIGAATRERSSWFFVSNSDEGAVPDSISLRTLPMDPAERMMLREYQSDTARFGDGCVVHVLALELAPLANDNERVYLARDYDSALRERAAARRQRLERDCVLHSPAVFAN